MKRAYTFPERQTVSPPPSPPSLAAAYGQTRRHRSQHHPRATSGGAAGDASFALPAAATSFIGRLRNAAHNLANTTASSAPSQPHGVASAGQSAPGDAVPRSSNHHHHSAPDMPRGDADSPLPPGAERNVLQWPIIMLALPPIGSLFVGTAQGWSDSITLVLIGIYLYYLVKVPWELYYAAQINTATRDAARNVSATPAQRDALARLRKQEQLSFILVLVAPLIGGYTLHLAKHQLAVAHYLTPGNIILYVMAASMRPLTHVVHMMQGNTARLHRDIAAPDSDAAQLRRRLDQLELSLRELRLACATEDDVDTLKEEVRTVLDRVSRGARGQYRRERRARSAAHTRLVSAEERVRGVEEWCELQRNRQAHSLVVRFVWEPVSLLREAIGVAGVPLLGFGKSAATPVAATTTTMPGDEKHPLVPSLHDAATTPPTTPEHQLAAI
ncbi:hypothetical protein THASP1DRAFT_32478 [Thamnocephalis sphaerospora]|uniref:Uncharacterized protein n=1 Tax=Thamnocephalis sphaerospora TaxID=78915 RepID=A0A4P9XIY3_9FUNG|nr:hypothetical protein THASP1DRAFT_32478 [Thamnocephalis sphaerospora]|eukprot:RKP05682.1 hypothetical protein THASP1DRAFT_32478 [Thamnocephalis sphaerospora]